MKRIGVIGIGNPLRRDDGIGIVLLERLVGRKDELPAGIEYIDGGTGGMNLLHLLARFDIVVLIDAVKFCEHAGKSKLFKAEDVYSKKIQIKTSTHDSDFLKIMQLSEKLGESPDEVYIFGVQPKDTSHGSNPSPELQQKIDLLLDNLISEIKPILNPKIR